MFLGKGALPPYKLQPPPRRGPTPWTPENTLLTDSPQWRNRWGQGVGGRVPRAETSDREVFADVSGKKEARKKGKRGEN